MKNFLDTYPLLTDQLQTPVFGPKNIQIGRVPIPIELVEKAPHYEEEAKKALHAWRVRGLEYQLGYISLGDTTDPGQIERHNKAYQFSVIQIADDLQRDYEEKRREEEGTKLITFDPTKKTSIRIEDLEPWRSAVHIVTRRETARDMMSKMRVNYGMKRAVIPPMVFKHVEQNYQPVTQEYVKELETCAHFAITRSSNQLTLLDAMY